MGGGVDSVADSLTEKQKLFIDYYIETGNQTEAARLAGYKQPHVQGNQNLEKLREIIDKKMQAKEDKRIATQDEILRYLTAGMRQELKEDVVVVEGCGDGCSEAKIIKKGTSIKDATECAKQLAKRFGIDKPDETEENNKIEIILRRE